MSTLNNLLVKRLYSTAKLPSYANTGDIGADIYSNIDLDIEPGDRALVSTGISFNFQSDNNQFYIRIAPKSGLALKGIDISAGVIDASYRGECLVLMVNNSKTSYSVKKGQKIAQIIIEKAVRANSITEVIELQDTSRGAGGFGSSGLY